MDDIVTRLRRWGVWVIEGTPINEMPATYLLDAADEIERLRKELWQLQSDFKVSQTALRRWIKIINDIDVVIQNG